MLRISNENPISATQTPEGIQIDFCFGFVCSKSSQSEAPTKAEAPEQETLQAPRPLLLNTTLKVQD